jgi:hypothetical protein
MEEMAKEHRRDKDEEHPRSRVSRSEAIWTYALDATCSACEDPAYAVDQQGRSDFQNTARFIGRKWRRGRMTLEAHVELCFVR